MQIDIVRDTAGLDALRPEWERLQEADREAPFYSTFGFVKAWWSSYGRDEGHELLVLTARNNGSLAGIAPLSYRPQTRYGVPIKEVRFASHGDYLSFLLSPEAPAGTVTSALLEAVFAQSDWDILNLTNIPASTAFAGALLRSEHHTGITLLSENPYIDLRAYPDFEAFAAQRLPSHTRKYRNKLLRETDARFRVVEGDAENIVDRMAELHLAERDYLRARGRKERHSFFEDDRRLTHYRRVFEQPGATRTFVYEEPDGRLLGYATAFAHRRALLSWNSAYHPDAAKYRMRKVLQYDILDRLYAEGDTDTYDFGAGRYPWKFEWTDLATLSYRFRHDRPALTAAAPPVRLRSGPPPPPAAQLRAEEVRRSQAESAAVEAEREQRILQRARLTRSPLAGGRAVGIRAVRALLHRARPPVIYYVPHPDDEAIYMGASMWMERNRRTVVVALTSGGSSSVLSWINERLGQKVSREDLERSRMSDLRRSVGHLGVDLADVHDMDLADGQLTVAAVRAVVDAMARRYPRASHRTMSYVDPHPDHAAAGEAVRQAHADGTVEDCLFHVPVDVVDEAWGTPVELSTAACDAKRGALAEYRVWDPFSGRYAVGLLSVPDLIASQTVEPRERVHGPDHVHPPARPVVENGRAQPGGS